MPKKAPLTKTKIYVTANPERERPLKYINKIAMSSTAKIKKNKGIIFPFDKDTTKFQVAAAHPYIILIFIKYGDSAKTATNIIERTEKLKLLL